MIGMIDGHRGFPLLFTITLCFFTGCTCTTDEYNLIKKLLQTYDVNVRPVINSSDALTVKIGVALNQLIDLDERDEKVVLKVWMRLRWVDELLQWNASDYGGLSSVRILPTSIWRPDVTLYTDLQKSGSTAGLEYPVIVSHDGSIAWNLPRIVESTCSLDVTYFPWDEQRCLLKFGSWSYDGTKMDLLNRSTTGDVNYFAGSGQWTLVGFPLKRNVEYYACCPEPYPDVTFYMIIRRKPLYYLYNLILPCLFLTATTVLVFYLPPDSGEKVSLSVTVLLALTVFLLIVAEIMPPQSESIPVIGQYFGATIMMLAASTSVTVVVLNIHHRGNFGNEVPFWIRKLILDWLARPLCLRKKVLKNVSKQFNSNKVSSSESKAKVNNGIEVEDMETQHCKTSMSIADTTHINLQNLSTTDALLTKIVAMMAEHSDEKKADEKIESCRTDWMLVAMVLDRFFLLIFFILTVVVSLAILMNYPTYDPNYYTPI